MRWSRWLICSTGYYPEHDSNIFMELFKKKPRIHILVEEFGTSNQVNSETVRVAVLQPDKSLYIDTRAFSELNLEKYDFVSCSYFSTKTHFEKYISSAPTKKVVQIHVHQQLDQKAIFDEPFVSGYQIMSGSPGEFITSLFATTLSEKDALRDFLKPNEFVVGGISPLEDSLAKAVSDNFSSHFILAHFSKPFVSLFYVENGFIVHRRVERLLEDTLPGISLEPDTTRQQSVDYNKIALYIESYQSIVLSSFGAANLPLMLSGNFDENNQTRFSIPQIIRDLDPNLEENISRLKSTMEGQLGNPQDDNSFIGNLPLLCGLLYNRRFNLLDRKYTIPAALYCYKPIASRAAATMLGVCLIIFSSWMTLDSIRYYDNTERLIALRADYNILQSKLPGATEIQNVKEISEIVSRQKIETRVDHIMDWLSSSTPGKVHIKHLEIMPENLVIAKERNGKPGPANGKFRINLIASIDSSYGTGKHRLSLLITNLKKRGLINSSSFSFEPNRHGGTSTLKSTLTIDTKTFYRS